MTLSTTWLVNILYACPNLRRLYLHDLELQETDGVDLTPVPLQYLEALNLMDLDIACVLPLLSSKSDTLDFSITVDMDPQSNSNLVNYIINFLAVLLSPCCI